MVGTEMNEGHEQDGCMLEGMKHNWSGMSMQKTAEPVTVVRIEMNKGHS